MSKKICLGLGLVFLVIGLLTFAGCEKAKPAGSAAGAKDVVATVGNEKITLNEVDEKIAKMPPYYQSMLKDRKKELVEDLVLEKLFYNEAKVKGLENDKEVKELLAEARKKIIISKFIKDEIENKAAITDKEVQDYYDSHKEEFSIPERWRASHILVKTEQEAKGILDELSKGKSFEELAKEKSQDVSAKKGGDLGYFAKGQMVPEFEEAVIKLEVGQTSGIVKTQFGYHVIRLTDKKPPEAQQLKDVEARIKNELLTKKRREIFDKLVADLKSRTKTTINESLLSPPPAAKPNAPEAAPTAEQAQQGAEENVPQN
jgi:peptidyl-prolyl cis-trans isomerase C